MILYKYSVTNWFYSIQFLGFEEIRIGTKLLKIIQLYFGFHIFLINWKQLTPWGQNKKAWDSNWIYLLIILFVPTGFYYWVSMEKIIDKCSFLSTSLIQWEHGQGCPWEILCRIRRIINQATETVSKDWLFSLNLKFLNLWRTIKNLSKHWSHI